MAVNFKLDLKLIQEWQKKDFRLVDKIGDLYDKVSAYERYVNFDSTQSLNDGL
jgi:hypothetical protein